jgi:ataxia telangiectasia mutated family protein
VGCIGLDGVVYRQLVKGGDDMRQDAVMEQVFEHVNHSFVTDDATRRRGLGIRTYKIVPTTPQTGVLQWVELGLVKGKDKVKRLGLF